MSRVRFRVLGWGDNEITGTLIEDSPTTIGVRFRDGRERFFRRDYVTHLRVIA